MRYKTISLIIAVFVIGLFTACQQASVASNSETVNQVPAVAVTPANTAPGSVPTENAPPTDNAPRISLEEAKADFDKKDAIFVDTRAEDAYKIEHIKDAINIPLGSPETRFKELPKDKKIIAYCS